jgi:hypothetical protein
LPLHMRGMGGGDAAGGGGTGGGVYHGLSHIVDWMPTLALVGGADLARCMVFARNLHSRMPLVPTPARVKRYHTCDVIGVATEFMVGVAGVEARPYV